VGFVSLLYSVRACVSLCKKLAALVIFSCVVKMEYELGSESIGKSQSLIRN
jgi:hypothetical protein